MPENDAPRYLGLVAFALGGLFAFWAAIHLGRQYSVEVPIQKDHQLITTGPYRYIRHPRYLGAFVLAIGFANLLTCRARCQFASSGSVDAVPYTGYNRAD